MTLQSPFIEPPRLLSPPESQIPTFTPYDHTFCPFSLSLVVVTTQRKGRDPSTSNLCAFGAKIELSKRYECIVSGHQWANSQLIDLRRRRANTHTAHRYIICIIQRHQYDAVLQSREFFHQFNISRFLDHPHLLSF